MLGSLFFSRMTTIKFNGEYFSVKDTLECGQVFRFRPYDKGYLVFSLDKCAYCYNEGDFAFIECKDSDEEYFYHYFDLARDYAKVYNSALNQGVDILTKSAMVGKGIRILNQDPTEAICSFIISQNNNIPRIKGIIEKLSFSCGEKKYFNGIEYFSFPSVTALANNDLQFFRSTGLGYRAEYVKNFYLELQNGLNVDAYKGLSTRELKKELTKIHGVGPKVANCVSLFGFHRTDSFPVDTWIAKVYEQDFKGKEKNREKITEWFLSQFKDDSGYFQQYLFHYKRILEKKS